MPGVNGARGEVVLCVDGAPLRLCLTLGALAEIETELGAHGALLAERLRALNAQDLLVVTHALLRGGGDVANTDELARLRIDAVEAANAVAAAFEAAFSQ